MHDFREVNKQLKIHRHKSMVLESEVKPESVKFTDLVSESQSANSVVGVEVECWNFVWELFLESLLESSISGENRQFSRSRRCCRHCLLK